MATIDAHHDHLPDTRPKRERLYWKNRGHAPHFRSHEEEFDAAKQAAVDAVAKK